MNIKDIARLSGYSVGTVSRVLNSHAHVSDEARDKIMSIVKHYQFEPNANARELKRAEKACISVFVKGRNNPLFAQIVETIHTTLDAIGEDVFVAYLDEDENEVRFALRHQQSKDPKGIIFLGGELNYFKQDFDKIRVPSVLLTNSSAGLAYANLSSVLTNDSKASGDIVQRLIDAGHKHIGILGGNLSEGQISARRVSGAIRKMAHNNISYDITMQYEPSRFSMESGYNAFKRLLKRSPELTAVFALGDVIAMGALRAAKDLGIEIPRDMSLVGFDGINSVNYSIPRITTVKQDTQLLAQYGVSTLLKMMSSSTCKPVCCMVPHLIQEGESIASPSGEGF